MKVTCSIVKIMEIIEEHDVLWKLDTPRLLLLESIPRKDQESKNHRARCFENDEHSLLRSKTKNIMT